MDNASKLFRIRKTVYQMLAARKYAVSVRDLEETKEEFLATKGDDPKRDTLNICLQRVDNEMDLIYVFFPEEEKVGVKKIKEYMQKMREENVNRAIIVVQAHLTPFARQCLLETERGKYHVEQFHEQELLVNITQHTLVPKHELLEDAEKKQLLERYKVKEGQLPRIQMHDPVARFLGLKRGNVVRIIRPSETAGQYVTYRLCV